MKKTSKKAASPKQESLSGRRSTSRVADEMRAHYDFDYSKARPNRFAARLGRQGTIAVVLEPDVAKVFDSAQAVNAFLRSAIAAMPQEGGKKRRVS